MDLSAVTDLPMPAQSLGEWFMFLEFAQAYFRNRGILYPLVVEIGTLHGDQREYYKRLLRAEHIGIDVDPKAEPDILGDTADDATVEKLKERLAGRPIDLLFIDGCHSYEYQWNDYNKFAALTEHMVAIHDILHIEGTEEFWRELTERSRYNPRLLFLTFGCARDFPSMNTAPVAPMIQKLSEDLGVEFETLGRVASRSDGFYGIGVVINNEFYKDE